MKTITYEELVKLNMCKSFLGWYLEHFTKEQEVTFDDFLKCGDSKRIYQLIFNVKSYKTKYHLNKYLEMKPDWKALWMLMTFFKRFQTQDNFDRFLEMKPDLQHCQWLVSQVKKFQTEENYKRLENMKD